MGIRPNTTRDVAQRVNRVFTVTANGDYGPVEFLGVCNFSAGPALPSGAVVELLDSTDGGTTYYPTPVNAVGGAVVFNSTLAAPRCVLEENEPGVQYIARVSGTWTGTIPIRFSA